MTYDRFSQDELLFSDIKEMKGSDVLLSCDFPKGHIGSNYPDRKCQQEGLKALNRSTEYTGQR